MSSAGVQDRWKRDSGGNIETYEGYMPPDSLTTHLLELDVSGFERATRSTFLEKAGKGTLSKEVLQRWLSQDRLYAQAYIRFASLLLANIPLPSFIKPDHINERLTDLIIDSISNVRRELKFFEDVAARYGLDISAADEKGKEENVSEGVKGYRELFNGIGEKIEAGKLDIQAGLVLLWGTEKCYLEAWRYAASFLEENNANSDADGGALRKEFIPNWTSSEFAAFVDKIGQFMDDIWRGAGGDSKSWLLQRNWTGKGAAELWDSEGIWREVLRVEEVFWPNVE